MLNIKRLKFFACIIIFTFSLFIISGCGSKAVSSNNTGEETIETAQKDDFPSKPVKIIVQYGAGGGVDVTARLLAKYAEKYLGQNIVVENRTGGSGVVGVTALANSDPDGYTLGIIFPNTAVEKYLLEGVTYSLDSFEPIVQINFDPAFLVTKAGGSYDKPLSEIIAEAKTKDINMGIGALWQGFDFVKLLLAKQTGAEFKRIGYEGGAAVAKALLAGDVDLGMLFPSEWVSYYQSGDMRGLAVAAEERLAGFEEVPTFRELGIDIGNMGVRRFLVAPKGIDPNRRAILEEAFLKALNDPELQKEYESVGMSVLPAGAEESVATLNEEAKILIDIVVEGGFKPGDPPR